MTIEFSEDMKTNMTLINSTFIDIFINPYDLDEYKELAKEKPTHLNMTWNATQFLNRTLSVKITFNDTLYVSKGIKYDNISFNVINSSDVF